MSETGPSLAAPPDNAGGRPPAWLYAQCWADAMAEVLRKIVGAAFPVAVAEAPSQPGPPGADDLLATIAAAGGARGEMSLRFSRALGLHLAQVFVGEAPEANLAFTAEHREAVQEWLRQVAGLAASAMKARWGEVSLRVEMAEPPPSWAVASRGWLLGSTSAPFAFQIEWQLSAALQACLVAVAPAVADKQERPMPSSPADRAADPLNLLLDV